MEREKPAGINPLFVATCCSLLAMLVHPFLWETLLSPIRLYQLEYPTLQSYASSDIPYLYERYPLWSSEFWQDVNYFNAVGLLLWLTTLVTLLLNRERLRFSHLGLFLVMTALACAGGRELAVAGIVNAALATVNAQQWYRASFRQAYSVEMSELLFARGGRALTVMAYFALGFAMVSGHLPGADGRRVGMGFDPQLKQTIASYEEVLQDSFDDRPFNFRLFQGDVLNWIGRRPFIDSRVRLFAAGDQSLVDEHVSLRLALRLSRDGASNEENLRLWQTAFDRYAITHVLPRLSGNSPDYNTYRDLSMSGNWTLTRLGAATAVFYRTDSSEAGLQQYVAAHDASNFVDDLLRSRDKSKSALLQRPTWPRPPTIYERYLYLPNPLTPNVLQLARHYTVLLRTAAIEPTTENALATAYGALRSAHAGLAEKPSDRTAYHVLGQTYEMLRQIEGIALQQGGMAASESMRNVQVVSAYHHALQCDPTDAEAHYELFRIYATQQQRDLTHRHLQQFQELTGKLTPLPTSDPNFPVEQERNNEFLLDLTDDLADARQDLEDDLAAGAERTLLVQTLVQSGFPLIAVETLQEDLTLLSGNPELAFFYGQLLLQVGRTSEAHDQLLGLRGIAEQSGLVDWPTITAFAQIIAEDLTGALSTMREEHDRLTQSGVALLVQPGPLQASGPTGPLTDGLSADPLLAVVRQTQSASLYFDQLLPRLEANELRQALVHLERGDNEAAAGLFQGILVRDPTSSLRPVAELYLSLLTDGADIPPLPSGDDAAGVVPDLFGSETSADNPADKPEQSPPPETGEDAASGTPEESTDPAPPTPSDPPPL